MSDFGTYKIVRGRKKYRCILCGYRIRKGATHIVSSGIYDGSFCSSRQHLVCNATANANWDWYDWETFCNSVEEFRKCELGLPLIDLEKVP